MKLHEREKLVRAAGMDLSGKLLEWMSEGQPQLTGGEELKVVGGELGRYVSQMAKYQIRRERHGDEDTPGGLADGG